MDFVELKIFVSAVTTESFSKAAELCCTTQSNISKQIHKLEEELGFKLFERYSRGVIPTNAAKHLCHSLEGLSLSLESAISEARKISAEDKKSLHFYIHESFNSEPLELLLSKIDTKANNIDVKLDVGKTAIIIQNVRIGIADLGLIHSTIPTDVTDGLARCPVKRGNFSIYYHKDLVIPKGEELTIDDFRDAPFACSGILNRETMSILPFEPKIIANLDSIRSLQLYASMGFACALLGNHQIVLNHKDIRAFEIETQNKIGLDAVFQKNNSNPAMKYVYEALEQIVQ